MSGFVRKMRQKNFLTWLDLEMGGDMTGIIEYGHQSEQPPRMTMSRSDSQLPLLPAPKKEGKQREEKEEKVSSTVGEVMEG